MADKPQQVIKIDSPRPLDNIDRRVEQMAKDLDEPISLVKASFIGAGDVQTSNVQEPERGMNQHADIFHATGALEAPYSPEILCKMLEHSHTLRQNIDAYCVNIDGNGHRFEPVIDLENDDEAFEQVRDAMYFEALAETDDPQSVQFPTDIEVEERIESMIEESRLEKAVLDAFFRFSTIDESFISLRKRTRFDKELIGNGYWEVLRDGTGKPCQFTYIPGFTVRLMPLGGEEFVKVQVKIKRTPFTFEEVEQTKRFRRYVQIFEGKKVYFKEYGDPRVLSAKTGKFFKTVEEMQKSENEGENAIPATEILHFPIHSPRTPYGIPRWIGTLLAVMGSRQAEEVNFLYFENKSVPPMAILISGGRLTSESTKKVEDFIKNRIKGRENFHSVMILEAEPAAHAALDSANARMKIEIVPLTDAQQSDALFQNYDERSIDKVGMAFRLPRLLRGDVRDFNRATADAALEFSEMQVFSPEREDFDWLMNRKILTDLNIKFWTFASNAPTTRDPLDLAEIVTAMVKNSILVPEEARDLAKAIFNKDFKKIDEIWTKIPPELLKVGILPEGEGGQFLDGPDDEGGEVSEEPPDDNEEAPEGEGAEVERSGKGGDKGAAKRRRGRSTDKNREGSDGFTKIPKRLVAARYQKATGRRGLMKLARDLVDLRSMLDQAERSALIDEGKTVRKAENEEPPKEVIKVSAEEWSRMIETVDE